MASTLVGQAVAPGDTVYELPEQGLVKVGNGLLRHNEELRCCVPGTLLQVDGDKHLVHSTRRRYSPVVGDHVIGYVTGAFAEVFKVDIGAPCSACLPILAFENATKRNRPKLEPGHVVYACVASTSRDMDPELTCMNQFGKAAGMGPLEEGYVMETDTRHAAKLLGDPKPAELLAIASQLAFEMAVGHNGRVWVHSQAPRVTAAVVQILQRCRRLGSAESEAVVQEVLQ